MNKIETRINRIVERGYQKNTKQIFGFTKNLLKQNMDDLKEKIIDLEIKDEKTQKMREKAIGEKQREQKSISRTLRLIQSHNEFLTSTRTHQIQNPTKKISSIFDIVKKHKKKV